MPVPPLLHFLLASGLGACLLATACTRRPPPMPELTSPKAHVPEGCEENLAGAYIHSLSPAFRYLARDDGTRAVFELLPADAGIRIEVWRSAGGFRGHSRSTFITAQGTLCELEFPTEITQCDGGIVFRSLASKQVGPACEEPPSDTPPPLIDHRLLRDEGKLKPADGGK